VPTATSPETTRLQVCGSSVRTHASLVPEKYGSRRRPVSRAISGSCPASRMLAQMPAVRRSCHTIARRGLPIVSRSQKQMVSRWLVMPTAVGGSALASGLASSCRSEASVAAQISPGSCSTQPSAGKCWGNSL